MTFGGVETARDKLETKTGDGICLGRAVKNNDDHSSRGELNAGIFKKENRKKWDEFRCEYEAKIASGMGPSTRRCSIDALNHFERICKPKKMQSIKTQTIDEYVSLRRKERGLKKGDMVAAATVNKELRTLKAILRIASTGQASLSDGLSDRSIRPSRS